LTVDPSTRQISADGRSETVEPRVMRVLVALGEEPGRVFSRDELIELCWDGQLVTDNAVTRVISMLRHALDDLSGGAVRIETIKKVGIRLVVDGQAAGAEPAACTRSGGSQRAAVGMDGTDVAVWPREWTRRAVWVGLAGAATAAASLAWLRSSRHTPDPRAVELYRRGQAIQKAGEYETMSDALEAYKQSVAIDPRYADAWGALALSYRYPVVGPILRLGDPQEVRVAARRALALDPSNADARLALITLYPAYRRWQEREAQLRAFVRDHPDSALGHVRLGELLIDVGRIEDAVSVSEYAIHLDSTRKVGWYTLAWAHYYAGRYAEGKIAIEEARSRWPEDYRLYARGFFFLLYGKRYDDAVAYISDLSRRPRIVGHELADTLAGEAKALATGRGIAEERAMLRAGQAPQMEWISLRVPALALFGLADETFTMFEGFFFGGVVNGTRVDPPGPLDPRPSEALFDPAVLSLRDDPRFARLLARTGLEEYWHTARTLPDFRRG
jgi:DNA-binding winged helix-turn-helix (wHTH) protein/tetratricopeptide (TPR) repeat protein